MSLFLVFVSMTAFASDIISARVVSVVDGNTIEIQSEGQLMQRVIIAGIDCPELTQEFGEEAKRYVENLILQKNITVQVQGKDRKGNYVGVVMVGNTDLRTELLKEGLAWTSEKEPLADLETLKSAAQKESKGLWKSEKPTPPWTHRREQSMLQPKGS